MNKLVITVMVVSLLVAVAIKVIVEAGAPVTDDTAVVFRLPLPVRPQTMEEMTSEDCVTLADRVRDEYRPMRPNSTNQLETLRNVVMAVCEDYKNGH